MTRNSRAGPSTKNLRQLEKFQKFCPKNPRKFNNFQHDFENGFLFPQMSQLRKPQEI